MRIMVNTDIRLQYLKYFNCVLIISDDFHWDITDDEIRPLRFFFDWLTQIVIIDLSFHQKILYDVDRF